MTVRIQGGLPDFGKEAAKIAGLARAVVAKSAQTVEGKAKLRAPVRTGNLRNSISTTIIDDGLTAEVGPTASYAPYVEFGTARQAPQPFLIPAAEEVTPEFEKALEKIADLASGGN